MLDLGYIKVENEDTAGELYIIESKKDFDTNKVKFSSWDYYNFIDISFPCLGFYSKNWAIPFNPFLEYAESESLTIAKKLLLEQKENIDKEIFSICLEQIESEIKETKRQKLELKLRDEALKRVNFNSMKNSIIYFIYKGREHVGMYLKQDYAIYDFKDKEKYSLTNKNVEVKVVLPIGEKETSKIFIKAIKEATKNKI